MGGALASHLRSFSPRRAEPSVTAMRGASAVHPGISPTPFPCEDGCFLSGCTRSRDDHTALYRHRGRLQLSAFVKWKTLQTTQVGELSPSFLHEEAAKWFKYEALGTLGTPLGRGSRRRVKTVYSPLV